MREGEGRSLLVIKVFWFLLYLTVRAGPRQVPENIPGSPSHSFSYPERGMLQFGIGFMGQQFENITCGTEPHIASSPEPDEGVKAGESVDKKQRLGSHLI